VDPIEPNFEHEPNSHLFDGTQTDYAQIERSVMRSMGFEGLDEAEAMALIYGQHQEDDG